MVDKTKAANDPNKTFLTVNVYFEKRQAFLSRKGKRARIPKYLSTFNVEGFQNYQDAYMHQK